MAGLSVSSFLVDFVVFAAIVYDVDEINVEYIIDIIQLYYICCVSLIF